MIRPPNLKKMTMECPECGAEAKYVEPSILNKIAKKPAPGAQFKCTKCGNEFRVIF